MYMNIYAAPSLKMFKNMTVILDDGVFPKRRKEGNVGLIEAWGRGN